MSDNSQQNKIQECFADIFEQLRDQDIEQFYAHYQLWVMRHRVPILENEIETLRAHVVENQQHIQELRPSAIALAVLARLQSNGVSDIELLDQMLERGEDWLDRMMQRLDYCEQVEDFIQGDYTQWCANSLEGAYDWIDTMRGSAKEAWPAPQTEEMSTEAEAQATTELLLHKLSFDDDEAMQDAVPQPSASPSGPLATEEQASAEEAFEETENPTYAQALEMLTTEDIVLLNEASTATPLETAEAEQVSSSEPTRTDTQPAPWYSISLEENEPFDFERPGSMDDWITVLQSDISPESEGDASPNALSQTSELPSEPITCIEQEEQSVSTPQIISVEEPRSEQINEIQISEVAPANLAVRHEAESSEIESASNKEDSELTAEVLHSETVNEQEICTDADEKIPTRADELSASDESSHEKVMLVEAGQEKLGAANKRLEVPQEATAPKKKGQYKAKKTLKLKQKTSNKVLSKISVSTTTREVVEEIQTSTCEKLSNAAETVDSDEYGEREQPADLGETSCEDQQQPAEVAEMVSVTYEEQPVQSDSGEPMTAEATLTLETSQVNITETGIVNAIFELEKEQLPWYEYLAMEQADGDGPQASQGTHEIAEHNLLSEQLPIVIEHANDETQPIALKEIRHAQEQRDTPETTLPAHNHRSSMQSDHTEAQHISEVDTTVVVSMPKSTATKQAVLVAERIKSEQIAAPQVADKIPNSIQEAPKKLGFWQKLWRILRKK